MRIAKCLGWRGAFVVFLSLLSGCGSLLPTQPYTARADWPLAPAPPEQQMPVPGGKVVVVRDLAAGPGLDQRGVATIGPSGAIGYDYYNQWAVDPADAATGALTEWLSASGKFGAVIGPGSRLDPDLIVEGELTEFVADSTVRQSRAIITLTVLNADHTLLGQRRLLGIAPLADTAPADVIRSERAAMTDALRQSVSFVAAAAGR